MERCSSQALKRIVLQGFICGVGTSPTFLISQRLPGPPTFCIYRSLVLHSWSETPSFKTTFAQMGFRSLSFILQAYLYPTSKPAVVLTCPVCNLIKNSLCLDEFPSKIKEPDVCVWGKGREAKIQGTERRCPGLTAGPRLCGG